MKILIEKNLFSCRKYLFYLIGCILSGNVILILLFGMTLRFFFFVFVYCISTEFNEKSIAFVLSLDENYQDLKFLPFKYHLRRCIE